MTIVYTSYQQSNSEFTMVGTRNQTVNSQWLATKLTLLSGMADDRNATHSPVFTRQNSVLISTAAIPGGLI